MRRLLVLVLVLGSALSFVPSAQGEEASAFVDPLILRRAGVQTVLVHVDEGASAASVAGFAGALGLGIGSVHEEIGVFAAYGTAEMFLALAGTPSVQALEANRRLEYLTNTSHIATRGEQLLRGGKRMKGARIDGTGVGVAIVDSGMDGTHPDLASRVGGNVRVVCTVPGGGLAFNIPGVAGMGFSECHGPREYVPMNDTDVAGGHGTHVSGIVAGTGQASGFRFHGAAPGAMLYTVAAGTVLTVENSLDGLAWVLANHDQVNPPIRVVNNSWGGGYREAREDDPLTGAVTRMQNALIADGVTVVFAAGNSGGNGTNPTTSVQCVNTTPGNICVANYYDQDTGTRNGTIDSSSSRGRRDNAATPADEDLHSSWPDISAPGTFIISTCRYTHPVCWIHAGQQLDPPNAYSELSGTSMAAPHVAGIVAQMYQVNPNLTPAQVEDILEDTAYKFSFGAPYEPDPFNPDDTTSFEKGHGLVDAVAAVRAAQALTRAA